VNREEFTGLPLRLALGVIWDAIGAGRFEMLPIVQVPRPPKYDGRLTRKGGFWWLSEMDLNSLQFWCAKKKEGAASGSQWAEKDGKLAATMSKWIEWRTLFPNDVWSGVRGDDRATAAAPSREPALRQWDDNGSRRQNNAPPPSADDDGRATDEDEFGF
jgi:hypothetical protein